ncbi:hypothetical protein BBJ28_00019324 [Nothophytophthora sp. Chile5]|nr:hypothetical protein BBJ28_00019324 [Nothophytophthora sp. Chile5]
MTEAKPTQSNRWDATWGEAATRDRIGDHTAARYRHFRRYIDEHDEAVDASLFAELVSVEELRRELQPYEEAGAFLRLALTGDLVEKLQHLNGVLDSAFAGGRVDLPERPRSWQRQLEQERDQRTEMYDVLLQHEERREEALPEEREGQLELLTMLKAGFETYAKDSRLKEHPLTDAEEQLISAAYDLLASRSGIVIPSLPVWFLASTDASDASKLARLGLSSSRPKSGTSGEVMETASQWWELHHPHIVRFLGACHMGKSPYFVHERTRSLALYLRANRKTRADVWERLLEAARGVEYLHRRGFVHKHLMPADFLCAEFEAKTLLSGMGLVACRSEGSASAPASADIRDAWNTNGGIPECPMVEDERPSVASDIYSLGRCVFAFLGFAATSAGLGSAGSVVQCQDLPSHCPEYLDASEWDLIQEMCATDLNHRVNMTYVLEKMQEIAYPVVDEEEDGARSTMENLDQHVLPGWSDITVREFLVEFDEFSSELGEPTRKAFTRLLQLHEMMKRQSRSLDSFSKAEGRDPLLVWSTLLSAATGLRYLHDVGVVHGDLKGNNILIGKDGVAKLTDFGLSFFRKNADLEAEQGALGAYRWKAPECLNGGVATFASDIFSFGMCVIEAVSGALPWGNRIDDNAVKYHVTKGELPNRPAVFEDEEWDLVQQMCCSDPKQRLNIVSVVVRLTVIVKRRDASRRQLLQTAYKVDMLADRENERMDAHTGGLDTLLQLVQSGVASHQNAARYAMQTFSALTQGNALAKQEVLQVVKLFHSDDMKQDWAAIALGYVNCPCSAIRADVTSWLVELIERESDGLLKAEAVRAIGYLASDETSRILIVSHGAISALFKMMSVGSDAEQAGAARTLGCLAIDCEQNQVAIADAGAINALVRLIRRGTYQERIEGALALRRLAEGNAKIGRLVRSTCFGAFFDIRADATHRDPARMLYEIARMRGGDEWNRATFPALVDLMLYGDDQQKNEAQTVLYARGHDRKNDRVKIPRDPVAILIAFVRVGTPEEKLESVRVLHRLVGGNDANRATIVREGGIAPLVALVRDGTDSQKVMAAKVMGLLAAGNDDNRNAIAREGGIAPLVALVRDGTDWQKVKAAEVLRLLAAGNDATRIAIAREGAIAPLVALVRDGTDSRKENAAKALGLPAAGNDTTRIANAQEGWSP